MAVCTFFGHRDCPESIKPKLREVLVDLITNHDVDMFYVGHQGQFDAYVHSELKKLKQENIHRSTTRLYWPICPARRPNTTTTPIQCSRRVSSLSIHTTPSPGAIIGCSNNPTMSSPMSPTLGAVQHSMYQKQKSKVKWL